jgi:Ca2+-dependent lipid-binding protein
MKDLNPTYNTRAYIPISLPAVTDQIAIRINDFNYIQNT